VSMVAAAAAIYPRAAAAVTEFAKCVSPVRHDQQNLGRFFKRLTQDWYFAIEY
jgi:hypothetical protein